MTKKYCDICGAEIVEPHPMANAYTCGIYPSVTLSIIASPYSGMRVYDLCGACRNLLYATICDMERRGKERKDHDRENPNP